MGLCLTLTSALSFLSSFQSSLLFTFNPVLLSLTLPSFISLAISLPFLYCGYSCLIFAITNDCDAIPDSLTREDNPLTVHFSFLGIVTVPWSPFYPREAGPSEAPQLVLGCRTTLNIEPKILSKHGGISSSLCKNLDFIGSVTLSWTP